MIRRTGLFGNARCGIQYPPNQSAFSFVLFVFLFACSLGVNAQIKWGDYSQSYQDNVDVSLIVAIKSDNNSFWDWDGDSELFHQFRKENSISESNDNNLVARTTFDSSKVHFFAKGIDQKNSSQFQFRVSEYPSKRIIADWQGIKAFSTEQVSVDSGLPSMAYVGGYRTSLGSMIVVEIKKIQSTNLLCFALVAWKELTPVISGVYTNDNFGVFLKRLEYPWAVRNEKFDPNETTLAAGENNLILFLNATIYHKEQVQYQLLHESKVEVDWRDNEFDNSFIWLKRSEPGEYTMNIRYAVQPDHVSSYHFIITPAWYQTLAFRIGAIVMILILIGGTILLILFLRQRRRHQQELQNRTRLQLELKGIRAQWNPHFVFNALGSIQGLINTNDLKNANHYLSDFAKLLRESLTRSERELVSIHEELQTLESYIKLERLRYGFTFDLIVDPQIDAYSHEIPSQLIQPLIENAIRHGASHLLDKGLVRLQIRRAGDDMIVTISDNGRGMKENSSEGYGLRMTRERIELLNLMNPAQQIEMDIDTTPESGTIITINFKSWLV